MVLLNPSIKDAKEQYRQSKFLKGIGYSEFSNGSGILKALQQHSFEKETSVTSLIESRLIERDSSDILYLESPTKNQASLDLKSYLSGLKRQVVINDISEVDYQTLAWYIASVVKAKAILVHLVSSDSQNHNIFNAEYSFYAGVAAGLGKKVLLIAPRPFRAPIDYDDILIEYESSHDCIARVDGWINQALHEKKTPNISDKIPKDETKRNNLLQLGIGYEMAEEEENLLSYYIEIETYKNALKRNTSIIIGRKGSGKSAMFIKLKDDFINLGPNSYSIILKPESDELLEDVELSKLYTSTSSKQSFLTSIWKYVIFSRLLITVAEKLLALPAKNEDTESIEWKIINFYETKSENLDEGHFKFISRLYRQLDQIKGFGNQKALEQLYNENISPILDLLRSYFHNKKYFEIFVVADNLDKTWEAENGLELQSEMILSLLSFNDKIRIELRNENIKPHTVVFLRTDIFEYVLDHAREPDKLVAKSMQVEWSRFPEKLKELIDARFRYSLDLTPDASVEYVWKEYFKLPTRKHAFNYLSEILVSRPRDYIFTLSKLFESAVNRNSDQIDEQDLDYGLEAYNKFLYRNMIAETRATYPEIIEIMKQVQQYSTVGNLDFKEFYRLLHKQGMDSKRIREFVKFLYSKDYGYAFDFRTGKIIQDYETLLEKDKKRILFFIRKYKIVFQIHPNRRRLNERRSEMHTLTVGI